MLFSFQRLKALINKELIQLKRDRATLAMMIMLPIVQLMLFGYAINMDPKHLPTAVISRNNTFLTRSLITGLQNAGYFKITQTVSGDKQEERLLRQGRVLFVVMIPDNFTQNVIRGQKSALLLQADATDPTAVSGAVGALNTIAAKVITTELKGALGFLKNAAPAFSIDVQKAYNPEGFTRYNIVPGLIGIILIFTGAMMTSLPLTREQERGTMENLLSMPVQPLEVMIGKITPFIFIGLFQSLVVLFIARFLFSIPVFGNLSLLFGCILLFILCNLAIGFLISTAAKNQTQALQMSVFVLLPSIMLTGFMFPFQGMPQWAQNIGRMIPLTYFVRIARGIMLKGAELQDIWPHLYPLDLIVIVITLFMLRVYQNTLD
ncbi:MAG: ABC transporter permease [Alphaproteobacteria bacterium]|nr:ABC transporter permease [Alphaproteobacteria bacterium]